jgi:hypothetical protein
MGPRGLAGRALGMVLAKFEPLGTGSNGEVAQILLLVKLIWLGFMTRLGFLAVVGAVGAKGRWDFLGR